MGKHDWGEYAFCNRCGVAMEENMESPKDCAPDNVTSMKNEQAARVWRPHHEAIMERVMICAEKEHGHIDGR